MPYCKYIWCLHHTMLIHIWEPLRPAAVWIINNNISNQKKTQERLFASWGTKKAEFMTILWLFDIDPCGGAWLGHNYETVMGDQVKIIYLRESNQKICNILSITITISVSNYVYQNRCYYPELLFDLSQVDY